MVRKYWPTVFGAVCFLAALYLLIYVRTPVYIFNYYTSDPMKLDVPASSVEGVVPPAAE